MQTMSGVFPRPGGIALVCLLLCAGAAGPGPVAASPRGQGARAHFTRGETLLKRGDVSGALKAFSAAIRAAPKDPRGYYQRGVCHERNKDQKPSMVST